MCAVWIWTGRTVGLSEAATSRVRRFRTLGRYQTKQSHCHVWKVLAVFLLRLCSMTTTTLSWQTCGRKVRTITRTYVTKN
ncbi:uncharacterized protein M421DRAFT_185220 [Didymella exigua CBS 183.55]|uniref:Uncharacterized protein n=1 Tax=Didymella exigua CBS 183.55 TaxID=1150837 RepID=A0A6A5RHF9_9PLEO|nr:uncharacterized protein M421DRAFT_185220 [Didymella exigua CBS 183.55]KAF1927202.1 hypothetical protein M421DRAFT_185220 [Didymella exigua CBS 183.55]